MPHTLLTTFQVAQRLTTSVVRCLRWSAATAVWHSYWQQQAGAQQPTMSGLNYSNRRQPRWELVIDTLQVFAATEKKMSICLLKRPPITSIKI